MATVTLAPPPLRRRTAPALRTGRSAGSGRRSDTLLRHPAASRAFLLLVLAAALVLGLVPLLTPPAVVPAGAPATAFSAERAVRHLEAIAAEPHPMGSAPHDAAAAYLVRELEAQGLAPQVQIDSSAGPAADFAGGSVPAGRVRNVLARLPGTDSTAPVLLVGNYDSMPTTPGAADPAASAAVVLETLRALRAGPPLRNDVVVAFVDGEPNGLIGDAAFVARNPWVREAGFVLAFSSSGVGGAVALQTTTPAGQRFLADILRASPYPLAYSSLTAVMRLMGGGGPMLWIARAHDAPGAEFTALDGPQTYHTVLNRVDRLDPRTLQHHGEYALALTRHLGDRPLTGPDAPQGQDLVFFTVFPGRVVAYPAAWAGPLALLVGLLGAGVLALGLRRGQVTGRGLAAGVVTFPLAASAAVATAGLAWWAIKSLDPDHQGFLIGVAYNADVYHAGLVALAVAAVSGVYALLGRWTRAADLAAGALLWPAAAMALASAALPGLSYLFTWPLLAALLALGWTFLAPRAAARPWLLAVALALAAAPAVALTAPFAHTLFGLLIRMDSFLPLPVGSGTSLVVALVLALLVPAMGFLGGARRWPVPAAAALVGLLVIGAGAATPTFDAAHPRPTSLAYVLDADTASATWVTTDPHPDAWVRRLVPAGAAGAARGGFIAFPNASPDRVMPAWTAAAPLAPLAAPQIDGYEIRTDDGRRELLLRTTSPRGAPNLYLDVTAPGEIVGATLDGAPLDLSAWPAGQRARFRLAYHAVPAEGVWIGLTFAAPGPVRVRLEDRSNGLPELAGVPAVRRPDGTMPAPFELADPTVVTRTLVLTG